MSWKEAIEGLGKPIAVRAIREGDVILTDNPERGVTIRTASTYVRNSWYDVFGLPVAKSDDSPKLIHRPKDLAEQKIEELALTLCNKYRKFYGMSEHNAFEDLDKFDTANWYQIAKSIIEGDKK